MRDVETVSGEFMFAIRAREKTALVFPLVQLDEKRPLEREFVEFHGLLLVSPNCRVICHTGLGDQAAYHRK